MPTENHNTAAEAVALADAADVRAADALRKAEAAHAAAVEYEARALLLREKAHRALVEARCTAEPGDVIDLHVEGHEPLLDVLLVSHDREHVVVKDGEHYRSRYRAHVERILDAETGDELRLPA